MSEISNAADNHVLFQVQPFRRDLKSEGRINHSVFFQLNPGWDCLRKAFLPIVSILTLGIGHMLKTWTFDLPLNSQDPPHPRLSPVWHPPPLKGRPGSQRPPPWGHLGRRTAGWIPLQNLARAIQEGVICLFECCSSAFTWFTTRVIWKIVVPHIPTL